MSRCHTGAGHHGSRSRLTMLVPVHGGGKITPVARCHIPYTGSRPCLDRAPVPTRSPDSESAVTLARELARSRTPTCGRTLSAPTELTRATAQSAVRTADDLTAACAPAGPDR